ncbi:DUF6338 family protein [Kitasatospora purpeofusca]|uniref:DUF6338 family protein n=1 Tax=Kitasatospora purpeofusca TaxID=67352 RepID=UPI00068E5D1C|nr:DUF6338 family protein [Kitasatospora purpeofusca]
MYAQDPVFDLHREDLAVSQAPATATQVAIILLLVVPGVTYQFVRERARGPVAAHRDLGERVLRALTAGLALDALYVIVAGPALTRLVHDRRQGWLTGAADNPRIAALTAMLLLLVVPACAAWIASLLGSRRSRSVYDPTPTAWDAAFRQRGHCLVRVRLKSGGWIGGWYGERSFASAYPESADLYLQTAWAVSRAGRFEHPLELSGGIHVRMDDVEFIDFVDVSSDSTDGEITRD